MSDICNDSRPCFARNRRFCHLLTETYPEDGQCPFCKPFRDKRADGSDYTYLGSLANVRKNAFYRK